MPGVWKRLTICQRDQCCNYSVLYYYNAAYGNVIPDDIVKIRREPEFIPYPLQFFAQRYLGLNYPQALTGLFPYWLKEIYRASDEKGIFYRYFEEILNINTADKDAEALLQEALTALKNLYQEFGIAFTYSELAKDPKDHNKLVEIIDSFGPMPCHIMPVNTEKLAKMIEDAIIGDLN